MAHFVLEDASCFYYIPIDCSCSLYYSSRTQRASDSPNSQGNVSSIEGAVFSANLRMIILNGSAPHTHIIANLRLTNVSSNENGTMTYNGSSTVSIPEGPIVDVPTTIRISGEVKSVLPNPSTIDGHFGETPIYAAISISHENDYRGPAYSTFLGPQALSPTAPRATPSIVPPEFSIFKTALKIR